MAECLQKKYIAVTFAVSDFLASRTEICSYAIGYAPRSAIVKTQLQLQDTSCRLSRLTVTLYRAKVSEQVSTH